MHSVCAQSCMTFARVCACVVRCVFAPPLLRAISSEANREKFQICPLMRSFENPRAMGTKNMAHAMRHSSNETQHNQTSTLLRSHRAFAKTQRRKHTLLRQCGSHCSLRLLLRVFLDRLGLCSLGSLLQLLVFEQ